MSNFLQYEQNICVEALKLMHTQLWGLHERLEETSADCNFALMKRPIFDSVQLGKLLGKSNMQGVSAEAQI